MATTKTTATAAEEKKTTKTTTKKVATKATVETTEAKAEKPVAKKTTAKKSTKKATAKKAVGTKAYDCIIRPVLTEESMNNMQNLNKITVEVYKDSNKVEIKNAFEAIFGVKVSQVNTSNVRARSKRVGRYSGLTSSYKKAVITLAEGQSLDLLKNKD